MGTALLTWELGGGRGHVNRLAPFAKHLSDSGHRVFVAARDLSAAGEAFEGTPVALLPIPRRSGNPAPAFATPKTFAEILFNVGFADTSCVAASIACWRTIFELVRPDVTIFDHSPFALLAARGFAIRRVVIGSGFFVPPAISPWPSFRRWEPSDADALAESENELLGVMNRSLSLYSVRPLQTLSELYGDADETFLLTYKELDHYSQRSGETYWGIANEKAAGKSPIWPAGSGQRIFAYLKPFAALGALFEHLNRLALPTLVVGDGIDDATQRRFASATLSFEDSHLNLTEVGESCDLAITNATMNTCAALLRQGKPMLMIPIMLEQGIVSQRIQAQGAGLEVFGHQPAMVTAGLDRLLSDARFSAGAERLANALRTSEVEGSHAEMFRRVEALITTKGRSTP